MTEANEVRMNIPDEEAFPGWQAENRAVVDALDEIAELLAHQQAGEFRVAAYRRAAGTIADLDRPLQAIAEHEGIEGLVSLPTVGQSIAHLIEQYLRNGHIPLLDRLRGEETAERVFSTIPTLGPELSRRIHEQLHIETLPELLAAARDGRLSTVPGMGRKRVAAIAETIGSRLRNRRPQPPIAPSRDREDGASASVDGEPVLVEELLDIDDEYRRRAEAGDLPRIAPRRFNPSGTAWLPVLHTEREGRHYTALYSNTARAHELNTTHDWVVIYRDDERSHDRWTVITSQFGKLRGCRIVRGREDECEEFYHARSLAASRGGVPREV